jgi:Cdc6-like AAA superfamily ATPase
MANKIFSSDFHFYQSANAEAERVKANFLIRLNEFDVIIDNIRRQPLDGSVQHFLLIGRRGSGKSTLLKRLQIELELTPELAQKFIAVNLAEEQANIYKLYDLLEAVLEELRYHNVEVDIPEWNDDTDQYARELFSAIHRALETSGKKLILLLDNIDRIFENLQEDASLLREYLLNYHDLKIIGGSTKMTEHFWKNFSE